MIKPDFSRGMKVRSSVKKLCEGCKVGSLACSLLFGVLRMYFESS